MTRTFFHSFDPQAASPVSGATVDLEVSEIEDAGIREVLQTPGAAYGAWSILDALLTPTGAGTPFVFREPLGQAREVKVALSGLFGRLVARAYLERYFNLSILAHRLPKRWVVERSFAWMTRCRRLVKDYERYAETLAGFHVIAFACLMLKRAAAPFRRWCYRLEGVMYFRD